MKATWNERYQNSTYQYGINPNDFLSEQLQGLQPGRILVPAAGEGRDMVYAAKLGWEAHGFDLSEQGEAKAIKLARDQQVNIHFKCMDAFKINYPLESFDVIALSFFHLPPDLRKAFHQRCVTWLKPGGRIILEGFNKSQLGKTSGGPKQVDWLFSSQELAEDFKGLTVQINEEKDRLLDEGLLHQGIASVIQFTAIN
ncbi:class I SAM-dependent methyltransferase [Aquirufa echingensis]|uniref:Class I SAM-dependent methyltransferase n=1 Tax=Aquirufa echingensis TaxID=3096516 RepID=A0ABW6CYT5_9BACT